MASRIYEGAQPDDAVAIAYRLLGLCRVGAAASDTVLAIDLLKGGWTDLFETMAAMCCELADAIEAEKEERKKQAKDAPKLPAEADA